MSPVTVLSRALRRVLPPGSGILFGPAVRRRLVLVVLGSLALAALELAGMATLLLLVRAFAGEATTHPAVGATARVLLGSDDPGARTLVLSGAVLAVFLAKAVVGLLFRRWVIGFMQQAQAETAVRLLERYLHGSYWRVLGRNSADLVRTMYDGTASVYGQVVGSLVQAIVEVSTIVAVVVFLLLAMPLPTLAAVAFITVCVLGLNLLVRRRAEDAGAVLVSAGADAYRSTLQALAGAKEIKVRGTQAVFVDDFAAARLRSARAGARVGFLGEAPRFVLEVLLVTVVLLVAGVVSVTAAPGESLPLIAIFVAAGVRTLPSAARVVAAVTTVRAGLPQLETVVADLHDRDDDPPPAAADGPRRPLTRSLRLADVHFAYPGSDEPVLRGVDLEVPAGTSLAVVGASGAGKSTLVDLVLGLHGATSGQVLVDGVAVGPGDVAWQRSIGLVPQDVFLLDDTLRRNVALGVDLPDDDARVREVLSMAHLDDFVAALPDGLDTPLGERGSRVSGGQRQRIGIARALAVEPALLVLDEATSALDNDAEDRIASTVRALRGTVTTLVVAHRLSTVRDCDRIAYLEEGRVAAAGTFEELVRDCPPFARLVELGRL